ncbi:MAG: CPBP family intramembrane metalloprotease [Bryobacterales bacterium]|nr:CPBP family intramembrane metalloprotease [Bryobacterales bacterium]MBV9398580.1 CPBP family intramembrane metalloprotease [Bryobacterales bacterium]
MFLPAIAVLIVNSAMNEAPRVQWDRFPVTYLPAALFLIPGVMHAAMLPVMVRLERGWQWEDWLTAQADGLYHGPPSRGWGTLTLQELVEHILVNAVVGLLIASFLSFFEEIGWRAWLLPRLIYRIGPRRAVMLTAVIWGFWHVPFQLSGIQHIDGMSPVKLALTLPFGIMITGLVIGWLWLRTQSIWIVSIAHGALNAWGQYAFKFMKDSVAPNSDGAAGTAGSAALLIVGIVLLWRTAPSSEFAPRSLSLNARAAPRPHLLLRRLRTNPESLVIPRDGLSDSFHRRLERLMA